MWSSVYKVKKAPEKHDGVVNISSALWDKNHAFDDENNIFMSDVQINANGVDVGGYNHFELRNYKRAYELRGNNGAVGFLKNDKNPAMSRAESWVRALSE